MGRTSAAAAASSSLSEPSDTLAVHTPELDSAPSVTLRLATLRRATLASVS